MSPASRPRLVLVAHHANPEWGSEPLIGWEWARGMDALTELTLVTHVRNRPAIERAGGLRGEVRYVDTEALAARVNRWNDRLWPRAATVNRHFLEAVALRAFDRGAAAIVADLAREGRVDVVHRVSPLSPRAPSRLGRLGLPFVVGPLNGGMELPPGFPEVERLERSRWLKARALARLADPFGRTFRDADVVFAATAATRRALPSHVRRRATPLCENAVDPARFPVVAPRRGPGLRALYLGRLLPYKGVAYALEALAATGDTGIALDVVGDGPDRARLERRARELNLGGRVVFHGAVPPTEVPARFAACDAFVSPSLRESGGAAALEAMATGRPVVVVDHGGPAETVVDGVGFKIAPTSPEAVVRGVARALDVLARNEVLRVAMGRAAAEHVRRGFTWDAKFAVALEAYATARRVRAERDPVAALLREADRRSSATLDARREASA